MATFTGQAATNNTFTGTAAADLFLWAVADLNNLDTATGGGGADVLQLTTSGVLASNALAGISAIGTIVLAAGSNGLSLLNSNFVGVAGAKMFVTGNTGNDAINAAGLTGSNAVTIISGAGLDDLRGGAGADEFRFAAADLAGDTVQGGGGTDMLRLTTAGVLGATALSAMIGVETIALANGTNGITLVNGNLTGVGGGRINMFAGTGNDTIDASGLTGSNAVQITSGAGLDVLTGGAGSDVFRFAAADLAGDTVNGGGSGDRLELTTAGVLGATALSAMTAVENIVLANGTNGITLVNDNLTGVAGSRLYVFGGTGNDAINASGLTGSNAVTILAGAGLDDLRGGAGADEFRFASQDLAGDVVTGGDAVTSFDKLIITTAGVLSAGALANVTGVETIVLAAGGNGIVLTNANLASQGGSIGYVEVIGGAGNDVIDASAITGVNSPTFMTAGAGSDTLKGGAGIDTFRFAATDLTAADTVIGGGGSDQLTLTTAGALAADALAGMTGVEMIQLANGTNALALRDGNFIGVEFAYSPTIAVRGGSGNDTIDASGLTGTNAIEFAGGTGTDVLKGGAGSDRFLFAAAELNGDTISGGAGFDFLDLTSPGVLAASALDGMTGVERILLQDGTNALTLKDANFAGTSGTIFVVGFFGNDTVDASGLTGSNNVTITAGAGGDTLKGGAGADTFRFDAANLAGDTVQGGSGFDQITLTTAGALAADALVNVTGIDHINLAAGGNSLVLTDANFTVPMSDGAGQITISGSAGSSVIDGSGLTGTNALYIYDGGGADTITGGAGDDFLDLRGRLFVAGDTFDGGAGLDHIAIDGSMSLLGNAISNVENVLNFGSSAVDVTISGENAAGLLAVGGSALNGVDDVFTIQLSADSTTNLSNLTLANADAADAINVVAIGGSTTVTLSTSIASFTGSADADTVGIAPGGGYMAGALINGGGGDDRIVYAIGATSILGGGGSSDTLVLVDGGLVVDLDAPGSQVVGGVTVANFENVDASAATAGVTLTGRDDLTSVLIGSSAADVITAGTGGALITGGLGGDVLTGDLGNDRFFFRSTDEAGGDAIDGGGGGYDSIEVLGDTDFSGATISNIDGLVLGARDAAGSPINASVTATLTGVQAAALTEVYGNAAIAGTVETLVVNVRDAGGVDLSTLNFVNWGSEDRVLINDSSDSNTITGTAQNDVILGNFGFDFLRGDGGDDVLGYDYGQTVGLDGGVGIDTLKLVSIQPGAVSISVNLALGSGNIIEDDSNNALDYTLSATNFENADFSLNVVNTTLIGTAGANVLIGGSGLDTITGGFGTDTLTGGGGPDLFVWNDKAEGGDTITDFEVGVDKLVFSRAAFGFASEPFDEQVYGTSAFFENYDLWSLAGLGAFSATEIQAILADFGQSTARASFIVATNAQGHSVLYFTPDSSKSSVNSGGDHTVYMIADLGSTYAPNQISLSDFVFI